MGRFVNPDNSAFKVALNSRIYIDKTRLLTLTNQALDTDEAFICNSRPRRFGKSVTANMLTAYYSKGCNSRELFSGLAISSCPTYEQHLNKYNVIHFDLQWCMLDAGGAAKTVAYVNRQLLEELNKEFPQIIPPETKTAYGAMSCINAATGVKFIVIIDEWDVLIRDAAGNQAVQAEYIDFLRGMFKGTEPTRYIHLAYLTGILPIKKLHTQSALNNFDEYTMLDAGEWARYVGFTENEVQCQCQKYGRDFATIKRWYDGYALGDYHVYNPKAVVSVLKKNEYKSYWSETGSYEAIKPLINMDFDGLKTAVITMMAGNHYPVNVQGYQNDMVSFRNKDNVITALIHLGYLAYDAMTRTAYIPNEEIRSEFAGLLEESCWDEFIGFLRESEQMLRATLAQDAVAVAACIERIHNEYASAIKYNDENSLSGVLTIAYLSAMKYYFKPLRELPTGRGFADFVFLPKPEYKESYPALLLELKWDKSATTAIQQIEGRKYPEGLLQYTGVILLVGINYSKKTKEHQCVIKRLQKQ